MTQESSIMIIYWLSQGKQSTSLTNVIGLQ